MLIIMMLVDVNNQLKVIMLKIMIIFKVYLDKIYDNSNLKDYLCR